MVKTALKLLIVFVEYTESNSPLLIQAVNTVDSKRGTVLIQCYTELLRGTSVGNSLLVCFNIYLLCINVYVLASEFSLMMCFCRGQILDILD